MARIRVREEKGFALVSSIVIAAVLMTVAVSSLIYSRSDVMVSDNAKQSSTALWIAQLGTERAKNFLRKDAGFKTVTAPTTLYAAGTTHAGLPGATYGTLVRPYGGNKFLIDSSATAPDGSSVRIQEVVAVPAIDLNLAAINLHGVGTHTKLDANFGVPAWFIDARNHNRYGQPILSGPTQVTRPGFLGTTESVSANSETSVRRELCNVRNSMIQRGNSCTPPAAGAGGCNGEKRGRDGDGAGRFYMHSLGLSTCSCSSNYNCNNFDLAADQLNAVAHADSQPPQPPTHSDTLWSDDPAGTPSTNPVWYRGPLVGNPPTDVMTGPQATQLAQTIELLLEFALHSNVRDRRAITADITTDTTTGASGTSSDPNRYGTWDNPVIAIICDPSHANAKMARLSQEPPCNGQSQQGTTTQIKTSSARVAGTGLLIVGREVEIGNQAQFSWRGIVLVLDSGRVKAVNINGNYESCGMVLGTYVLQADSAGNFPKLRFADAVHKNCANYYVTEPPPATALPSEIATIRGIGVKYSQEAIDNALTAGLTTLAWHEVYESEQGL